MTTNRKFLIFSFALIAVSALIAFAYSQDTYPIATEEDREIFHKLSEFYDLIEENFYIDIEVKSLFSGAINGLLQKLDPHSAFVDVDDYGRLDEQYRGNYHGIGVSFIMLDDKITIMEVIGGGPSDSAGLRRGDQIVEIEGESAIAWDSDKVQEKLRGPGGTKVNIRVERQNFPDLIPVQIQRGQIPIYSVDNSYMLDANTAYIRITRFARPTTRELERALSNLKNEGMKQVVLDLRGNSGGLLSSAIGVTDTFLSGKRLIVYTDGQTKDSHQTYTSDEKGTSWDIPIVVLIDHGSASASEIVAGAIQDWDRGLIVGQTSFGKGLVQTGYILRDRSRLLLTTSHYFTPTGRLIQRPYKGLDRETYQMAGLDDLDAIGGLSPEIEEDKPVYLTASGRTVYGGGGISPDEAIKSDPLFDRFTYTLSFQSILFLHARDYFTRDMKRWVDFDEFSEEFEVSDAMLEGLLGLAKEREFEFYPRFGEKYSDEQSKQKFWELNDQIRIILKAEIAQFYFDRQAGYRLRREARDSQLASALEHFEKARELADSHRNIDPQVFAARGDNNRDKGMTNE